MQVQIILMVVCPPLSRENYIPVKLATNLLLEIIFHSTGCRLIKNHQYNETLYEMFDLVIDNVCCNGFSVRWRDSFCCKPN